MEKAPLYFVEIHGTSKNRFWIDIKTNHPEISTNSPTREYFQYEVSRDESKCRKIDDRTVGIMNNSLPMNETQKSIAEALLQIPGEAGTDHKLIQRVYFTHYGISLVLKHMRKEATDVDLIEKALAPHIEPYHKVAAIQ